VRKVEEKREKGPDDGEKGRSSFVGKGGWRDINNGRRDFHGTVP